MMRQRLESWRQIMLGLFLLYHIFILPDLSPFLMLCPGLSPSPCRFLMSSGRSGWHRSSQTGILAPAVYLKAGLFTFSGLPPNIRTHLWLWSHPGTAGRQPTPGSCPSRFWGESSPALLEPPGLTWACPTLCLSREKPRV